MALSRERMGNRKLLLRLRFEYMENVSITSIQALRTVNYSFGIEDGRWMNGGSKSVRKHVVVTKVKNVIAEMPHISIHKLVNSIYKYMFNEHMILSNAFIWIQFARYRYIFFYFKLSDIDSVIKFGR